MFRTVGSLRMWRPALLVLCGAALAAALIGPVAVGKSAAFEPAVTSYTRTASCSGLSFFPLDTADGYGSFNNLRYRANITGSDGSFECDPGLPDGAVVTRVQFTVRDAYSSGNVSACELVRSGLSPAAAASTQVLAGPLGTSGNPGVVRLNDASIHFATVHNASYAYRVQCTIEGSDLGLGIYGANVVYTISAAKG